MRAPSLPSLRRCALIICALAVASVRAVDCQNPNLAGLRDTYWAVAEAPGYETGYPACDASGAMSAGSYCWIKCMNSTYYFLETCFINGQSAFQSYVQDFNYQGWWDGGHANRGFDIVTQVCVNATCSSPCQNGGVCYDTDVCKCPEGWSGQYCQYPICTQGCANGGTCTGPNECTCSNGVKGPICGNLPCPVPGSLAIGGATYGGASGCACPSGYVGNCTYTNYWYPSCNISTTTNTSFSVSGMDMVTANMSGSDTLVSMTLNIPMMQTRNYTGIYMSGPAVTRLPSTLCTATAFSSMTIYDNPPGPLDCYDSWILTAPFATLRGCGFNVSSQDNVTDNVQTYNGNLRVSFTETVTVGTGDFAQNLSRSSYIDFPTKINFLTEYTFNMTASNVTVYGTEQVDWAITDTSIAKDGANPRVTLGYTTQYPYAVTSWNQALTGSGSGVASLPGTAQAWDPNNSSMACFLVDYSASDNATAATCTKNGIFATFVSDGSASGCKFSDYVYTLDFGVQCVQGLPTADCPVNQTQDYSMSFTVNSENFCTTRAANNTINNVITINNFTGVAPTNGWAEQTAWRENDDAYFQMGFSGLPLQTCKLTGLDTQFGEGDITGVAWQTIVAKDNANTAITGATLAGFNDDSGLVNGLGVDTSGTRYRFKVQVSDALLGSGTQLPLIRGRDYFLKLRAIVDVTYDRAFTGLRRRRQAGTTTDSGSGSAESQTQAVGAADSSAAAPTSSASRVAPVVAMALAVLSAVVLA